MTRFRFAICTTFAVATTLGLAGAASADTPACYTPSNAPTVCVTTPPATPIVTTPATPVVTTPTTPVATTPGVTTPVVTTPAVTTPQVVQGHTVVSAVLPNTVTAPVANVVSPQPVRVLSASGTAPAAPVATTTSSQSLPFTGGDVAGLAVAGAALLGMGVVLVRRNRARAEA